MKLPIYQVDTFTKEAFGGNPAAVMPLEYWPSDELMQHIASENNLSETAFIVPEGDAYRIRWFTPATEVKLCGHATLASAFVLFNLLKVPDNPIRFESLSGPLLVGRNEDGSMTMNFPKTTMKACSTPQALWESLGAHPVECYSGEDILAVLDSEETLISIQPDFRQMATIPTRGIMVTARGNACDFVSRFFAPRFGIDEDPVTGSAHCALAPYWAGKLKKNTLRAIQRSKREGHLLCQVTEDRVLISGNAVLFLTGSITL